MKLKAFGRSLRLRKRSRGGVGTTWILLMYACFMSPAQAQEKAASDADIIPSVQSAFLISRAKSHSISPENVTGAKGQGGKTDLQTGSARVAAKDLGVGWKVNPYAEVSAGSTYTVAQFRGAGVISHLWMTLGGTAEYRSAILRFYWDGEGSPSVEVPVGDFFGAGWGRKNEPQINSATVAVNPGSGFNSFWQMPFRKGFRITLQNRSSKPLIVYYEVSFSETRVPRNAGYFHAQFRMIDTLATPAIYIIVDGIRGQGQYVGTAISHGARSPGWWGEGEVKFYIDGDLNPSINGTGEEDYFLGSYAFWKPDGAMPDGDARFREQNFSSIYSGFYSVVPLEIHDPAYFGTSERHIGEYRWHILDPIRFDSDLKVTIQGLGWKGTEPHTYLPLRDYYASVAYWYQTEPHALFPALPEDSTLQLHDAH